MKLLTYDPGSGPRAGVLDGQEVIDAAALLGAPIALRDVRAVLERRDYIAFEEHATGQWTREPSGPRMESTNSNTNLRFTAPSQRPLPEPLSAEALAAVRQRTAPPSAVTV